MTTGDNLRQTIGGVAKATQIVTTVAVDPATGTAATVLPPGRAAAAASVPVVSATEDFNEIKRASAGTKANVTSAAASTPIVAANTSRKKLIVANDSTAILYLDLTGGTASATSCSVSVPAASGGVFGSYSIDNFTGAVTGIWASANGFARVTELT